MDENRVGLGIAEKSVGATFNIMRPFRIIPRLDIKLENLIKGVQMEGWRKVGLPVEYAKSYASAGADELVIVDVVASLYDRNTLHSVVKKIASEIYIPLTIGGGIRTVNDVHDMLVCGADKITVNTAATKDPNLIKAISRNFGSQCCVVAIETIFRDGKWCVMTDNGRNVTPYQAIDWGMRVEELGAGEIILTSIHKDGLGLGMDVELISALSSKLDIPVIAGGGLGKLEHLSQILDETEASGVAIGQALHWGKLKLSDLRNKLASHGYYCRPINDK